MGAYFYMNKRIMAKAIIRITLGMLVLGILPSPKALSQNDKNTPEAIVSARLMREAERIAIGRSLNDFTQQVLPTTVKEAQLKGWDSNFVLAIFEHTLKQSIQSHSGSTEYPRFVDAVNSFTQSLRKEVTQVPAESARRMLLVASDGILLNRVKNSVVDEIMRYVTASEDAIRNGKAKPARAALRPTRARGTAASNLSGRKPGQALAGWRETARVRAVSQRDPLEMPSPADAAPGIGDLPSPAPRVFNRGGEFPSLQLSSPTANDGLPQIETPTADDVQVTEPNLDGFSVSPLAAGLTAGQPDAGSIPEPSAEMLTSPTSLSDGMNSMPPVATAITERNVVPQYVPTHELSSAYGPIGTPICDGNPVPHSRAVESLCDKIWHPPAAYPLVDKGSLLGEYQARTSRHSDLSNPTLFVEQEGPSTDYLAWWHDAVTQPFQGNGSGGIPVDVESLVLASMQHSPQIAAIQIDPAVRETKICEEDAEFDWTAFVEGTYDHISEPWVWNNNVIIGGTPVAPQGNQSRLKGDQFNFKAGLKRALRSGGSVEVFQEFDSLSNNQPFLFPNPANTAWFEVNVNKPLLRGNGKAVNQSRIVIAQLNRDISHNEAVSGIESHIVSLHEAYWLLYLQRASLIQKLKALEKSGEILKIVEARQDIDATKGQLMRTQAVVAKWRSEIPRLEGAVRNAQSSLRLLVNSPELKNSLNTELLPLSVPNNDPLPVSLQASFQTALTSRPDISAAMKQIHRTSIELDVSKNDLLPRFDLDLYMYTAGLQRNRSSFGDMFYHGPGVGAGLVYEIPIGNRRARSIKQQRELLLTKAFKEFEIIVESGLVETEQAVNDVKSCYSEMIGAYNSMIQARQEIVFADARWRDIANDGGGSLQSLDALFDSQDRMADEEFSFVEAQVKYELAVVGLKRALGTLIYEPAK